MAQNRSKYISPEILIKRLCGDFATSERIYNDPVEFPHRYSEKRDIEIVGFISALFSYGRVELFKPVIERILGLMDGSPYEFVLEFNHQRDGERFRDVYYRFQKDRDIVELIKILSKVLKEHKSIERIFSRFYSSKDPNTGRAIEGFSRYLLSLSESPAKGLTQLFPLPSRGSACKRFNLFLRWMVRKDEIDFGIWKKIPPNKLIIPLDVHISRISISLGLTKRKNPDWKMAVEITEFLKKLDPVDPLKYDFALCHAGMSAIRQGLRLG